MTTLKSIIENNGATLNSNGDTLNYNKGYQVSIKDLYIIKLYKLRKSFLMQLLNDSYNLGIWIDTDKKVYIDYSINISTKKQAIKQGKANKQLSIYDWKNNKVLYL